MGRMSYCRNPIMSRNHSQMPWSDTVDAHGEPRTQTEHDRRLFTRTCWMLGHDILGV